MIDNNILLSDYHIITFIIIIVIKLNKTDIINNNYRYNMYYGSSYKPGINHINHW